MEFTLENIVYGLGWAVMAGVIEEIVFRGGLIWLLKKWIKNNYILVAIPALLFGIAHLTNGWTLQILWAVLIGMYFGYIRLKHSIWWAIAAHSGLNLMGGLLLVANKMMVADVNPLIPIGISVAFFIYAMINLRKI